MEFGLVLSQFTDRFDHVVADAVLAEEVGLDSVWLADHLLGIADEDGPIVEAWTALTFVAARTERVRLGHLVNCVHYRNVGLLAKMATTLDLASSGRLDLGLGAGWYEREYRAFGFPFGDGGDRRRSFESYLRALIRLLDGETVDHDEHGVRLEAARVRPLGPQRPHPPIVVGAGGRRMLEAVGRFADVWNCPAGMLAGLEEPQAVVLRAAGDRQVRTTIQVPVAVGRTREEADEALGLGRAHMAWMGDVAGNGIVGTVDEALEKVIAYRDRGVSGLVGVLPGSRHRPDFVGAYGELARRYRAEVTE
jgi:alkanesulfonate monooxygenase SsuD/methylene tetrahydromethanopterin reductase-like flavin-dependent oxidoreductase (luciferase family)